MVAVRLLGSPSVSVDGSPVPTPSRKALGLLALLVLDRREHARERLAALLWPDSTDSVGRAALRNVLSELRSVLGDAIVADRTTVSLRRDAVDVDVDLVTRALGDDALLVSAVDRAGGDLLAGVELDELEDWLLEQREVWRHRISELHGRLARRLAEEGRHGDALDAATRRVASDPTSEPAHRQRIELLFATGDRDAALRAYEALRALLKRELGVSPSPETEALARRIVGESPPTPPRPSAVPPRPATPLVGRERDLEAVLALVHDENVRLVTLVGPGGVGKTRLAIEVAGRVALEGGARFVALASLREPELVLSAIARGLALDPDATRTPLDRLTAAVGTERTLLVLDNFEQIAEGAPALGDLLAACPGLVLLVTSRAVLRLRGERAVTLQPLELPEPGAVDPRGAAAVQLFLQRAREARHDFAPGATDLAAVAELCRRLDGLPLALELAAARVRALSPTALADRLGRRLPWLIDGPRDLPPRHRALRETLRWSTALLSPDEQRLFRRLAVFAGPFDLDLVAAVDPDSDPFARLAALVDQSLVQRAPGDRFLLLETIRELAGEELDAAGERVDVERRHLRALVAIADRCVRDIHGGRQAEGLDALAALHDDLGGALGAALADPESTNGAVALAGRLYWYWHLRGHWSEGRAWLRRVLGAGSGAPSPLVGRALAGQGVLACAQEDFGEARDALDRALLLLRPGDDDEARAHALGMRATVGLYQRDTTGIGPVLEESLALFRTSGDRFGEALTLLRQGIAAELDGASARSEASCREALALFRTLGNGWGCAMSGQNLGIALLSLGDVDGAWDAHRDAFGALAPIGSDWYRAGLLLSLAGVRLANGDRDVAARLFGAAEEWFATTRGAVPPLDAVLRDRNVEALCRVTSHADLDRWWAEGRGLMLDDAVRVGLARVLR